MTAFGIQSTVLHQPNYNAVDASPGLTQDTLRVAGSRGRQEGIFHMIHKIVYITQHLIKLFLWKITCDRLQYFSEQRF